MLFLLLLYLLDLRAKALSLAEGVNSDIQPLHNLGVLGRVGQMGGDQAKQEWGNWVVMTGLKGKA